MVSRVGVGGAGVAHLGKVLQGASSWPTVHLEGNSRAIPSRL
jgi:hypothetical protein